MTVTQPAPVAESPLSGRLDVLLHSWLAERVATVDAATARTDEDLLRLVPCHYLSRDLDTVSASDITGILAGLSAGSASDGSLQHHRESLSAFFAWCARSGLMVATPAEPAPDAAAAPAFRPFTADELEEAWAEWSGFSPVLADVMLVLARTGLRWSEARTITVADTAADGIRVDKTASEGAELRHLPATYVRHVPVAPRIRPIVERLAAGRDAQELLLTTSLGAPLHRGAVLRRLHWSETGRGRRLHDLRHTAAYLWLEEGVDPATVRSWMGPSRVAA
ncbi:MAG: site-specific integrase [Propionicimonas sp.]|nr:site-specific integrase [Propionicimonas sp.]